MSESVASLEIIRSRSRFAELAGEWNELVRNSMSNRVFLTWEWVWPWVETYIAEDQLLVIVLRVDNQPVALAPFWIERKGACGWQPVRVLRLLGDRDVVGDYLDLIVRRDRWETWTRELWDCLFGNLRGAWDLLEYADVPDTSPVFRLLYRLGDDDDRCVTRQITATTVCPYMVLPDSWDSYLQDMPKKRRQTLNMSIRRLSEQGTVQFRICKSPDDLQPALRHLAEVNNRIWRARGHTGSFSTREFTAFHDRATRLALDAGTLLLGSLWLNEQPIATAYTLIYDGVLYRYVSAVEANPNPRINNGSVLMAHCLQEAIRRGCTECDFLRGDEEYKYLWASAERRNLTVRFYNRTARSLLHLNTSALMAIVKNTGKVILGPGRHRLKRLAGRGDSHSAAQG